MGGGMKPAFTHPLHLMMGFILWSLWFVCVYAGLSLACILLPASHSLGTFSWVNILLLIFTLLITACLLMLALRCWRAPVSEGERRKLHLFITKVSAAVYLSAAIATITIGLPIVVLSPCG
jgi:hypothetical protein